MEVCFADSMWLLVERPFTNNSRKLLKLCGCTYETVQVSLFLLSGGAQIVNAPDSQGCYKE